MGRRQGTEEDVRMTRFHRFHPDIHSSCEIRGAVSVGMFASVEDGVLLDAGQAGRIDVGFRSKVKRGVTVRAFDGLVSIGNRVSIAENSVFYGHGGITVRDGTLLAPHCILAASQHIFDEFEPHIRFQGETARGIHIGEGVWIGARAVILDGVSVGDGAVIGAGAVVTDDIPPNSVAVGVPCRLLRKRVIEVVARA